MKFEIQRDMKYLNPDARPAFEQLQLELLKGYKEKKTHSLFMPFETYRSPMRQLELFEQKNGATQATAWKSAHQYGLAVDFVPITERSWSWSDDEDWKFLHEMVETHSDLFHPLKWDKAHVVHAKWYEINNKLL